MQLASDGSAYGLYGNLGGTGNSTNGMIWSNVTVSVPSPFSGNGQCTFTQLVNPNLVAHVDGTSKPQVPYSGILGIDGSFNYGSSWGVTAAGNDADSPNQLLYYTAGLTEFNDSDAFTTYVMYLPPSNNKAPTTYVPLQHYLWKWSGRMDLLNSALNVDFQNGVWTFVTRFPSNLSYTPITSPATKTDSHPEWNFIRLSPFLLQP